MKKLIPIILLLFSLFCVYFLYSYLNSVENTTIPVSDTKEISPIDKPIESKPPEPASSRQGKG